MSRNSWWSALFEGSSEKNDLSVSAPKQPEMTEIQNATINNNNSNNNGDDIKQEEHIVEKDTKLETANLDINNSVPSQLVEETTLRPGIPIPASKAESDTSETPSVHSTIETSASPPIPIPRQQNNSARKTHNDESKRLSSTSFLWWYYTGAAAENDSDPLQDTPLTSEITSKMEQQQSNEESSPGDTTTTITVTTTTTNNNNDNKRPSSPSETQLPPLPETVEKNQKATPEGNDVNKSTDKLSSSHTSTSSRSSWWRFGLGNGGGNWDTTTKDSSSTKSDSEEILSRYRKRQSATDISDVMHSTTISLNHKKTPSLSDALDVKEFDRGQSNSDPLINKTSSSAPETTVLSSTPPKPPQSNVESDASINSKANISLGSSSINSVTKQKLSENKRWSLFGTWSGSSPNLLETTMEEVENRNDTTQTLSQEREQKQLPTSVSSAVAEKPSPLNTASSSEPPSSDSSSSENTPTAKKIDGLTSKSTSNNNSWLYLFSNTAQTTNRIENVPEHKLITDRSETKSEDQSIEDFGKKTQTSELSRELSIKGKDKGNGISEKKRSPSPIMDVKLEPLNQVLPKFEELPRFRPIKRPDSIIQKTLHSINSYFFPPENDPPEGFIRVLDELTRSSVDVKRVAIIGVHGWYPHRIVRALVGDPTGTSPKFCEMMGKAVAGYLAKYGINLPNEAITLIPLEGEGKIETRVDLLFTSLLDNQRWREALKAADVIFVATHSQGTPVSTMLLSRLIQLGHVFPRRQRVCMLAMAGISHGPFSYLKGAWVKFIESDATRELFEFTNPESLVSKKYREALRVVTHSGTKLVYVASMDDQVVPVYSGIFTGADHPSILRAVFIDGHRENNFLSNLIVFAARLRNSGIQDHDLLVSLSEAVAGSLTGEGHSTLYEEIDVYTLSVRYLFETDSPSVSELKFKPFTAQKSSNPYYLPWAMRGVLEDKAVQGSRYLSREVELLRQQYDEWEPITKQMKDVKFRLEPLRAESHKAKL